jgi:hypothetical protein
MAEIYEQDILELLKKEGILLTKSPPSFLNP